eukprot:TRINITY_DN50_c0_g1_i1.p1 TRINITY_DN50_c0_g1~~TRINITY_DN50_c0_g1_i1.p1  ORF type:complete len:481 (+),score=129.33 TRINITY_DN50_c0_g1_i1:24-1466(+)
MLSHLSKVRGVSAVKAQRRTLILSARDSFNVSSTYSHKPASQDVKETKLDGGVRVLSVDSSSPLSTISVFVKAGSRYETRLTTGATHFLKHLGFKGTYNKSALRLIRDLEHLGLNYHTQISRETIGYHLEGLRYDNPAHPSLAIAAETLRFVLNPLLREYEVDLAREVVSHETDEVEQDPIETVIERLHAEAFPEGGLGNNLFAPNYAVGSVNPQVLHHYVKNNFYGGDRIFVVATGVNHGALVDQLTPLFTKPELQGEFRELRNNKPLQKEHPLTNNKYVGSNGTVRLPGPYDTHVAIGFNGVSLADKDALALNVLQQIIGGGAANKAGPGDAGKTSFLYKSVVEPNQWVSGASAFQYSYSDAGLFGVTASAVEGHAKDLVDTLKKNLNNLPSALSADHVQQGKVSLKGKFLRTLDSDRFALTQHLASGVLGGSVQSVPQFLQAVDGVSLSDVQRVAKNVLSSKPTVVVAGDVRGVSSN